MIKSAPYYWVLCDKCGSNAMEYSDFSAMIDADSVEQVALDADWLEVNGNHYCFNCIEWDEKIDGYIPKIVEEAKE